MVTSGIYKMGQAGQLESLKADCPCVGLGTVRLRRPSWTALECAIATASAFALGPGLLIAIIAGGCRPSDPPDTIKQSIKVGLAWYYRWTVTGWRLRASFRAAHGANATGARARAPHDQKA